MTSTESYIDYPTLLHPSFSPQTFANTLVLQTNNPADTPLDLSTPLSRVLFDVQEVDTHIDTLTTQNASPIISHTRERAEASTRVLEEVEAQVNGLKGSYERLEREVKERYEAAEQVRLVAERMVRTLRLGRGVQRAVLLGRQLEGVGEGTGGSYRSMVESANAVVELRRLFAEAEKEKSGLGRVGVVSTLRSDVVAPAERALLARAQQVVREFSMSSLLSSSAGTAGGQQQTYAQTEEAKSRTTSALHTLYLLSPSPATEPALLLTALSAYLTTALTASLAALSRALATLPTLDRTLLEISARCQNIVALESLLQTTKPPAPSTTNTHPGKPSAESQTYLYPLLKHLDTSSLPSFFWRSLAGQLAPRVQDILNKGGVSARTLRSQRERVGSMIKVAVDRGSRAPSTLAPRDEEAGGGWEREAAVMVGSVLGPLSR